MIVVSNNARWALILALMEQGSCKDHKLFRKNNREVEFKNGFFG